MRLLDRIAKRERSASNADMSREQIEADARKLLAELGAATTYRERVELTTEEYAAAKRHLFEQIKQRLVS